MAGFLFILQKPADNEIRLQKPLIPQFRGETAGLGVFLRDIITIIF